MHSFYNFEAYQIYFLYASQAPGFRGSCFCIKLCSFLLLVPFGFQCGFLLLYYILCSKLHISRQEPHPRNCHRKPNQSLKESPPFHQPRAAFISGCFQRLMTMCHLLQQCSPLYLGQFCFRGFFGRPTSVFRFFV